MSDRAGPRREPMTEQDLRTAWVVEPPRLTGKIQVADYDPEWPRLFQREAQRINEVLGQRVVRLEHTGSTSVPGLAAKPIIDILLIVPDSSDEPSYVPDLEAAGYVLVIREPERYLVFRDRLRGRPDERAHYQRVKRELSERDWTYVQQYADAKTEVVESIIARARAETAGG
jgi:GrpB-like predicted nucleotidyltransferase (UPF0157 family)